MIDIQIKFKPLSSDHSFLFGLLFAGALIWFLFGWTFCFNNFTHNDDKETAIFISIVFFAAPAVLALILCVFSIYSPTETV